MVFRSVTSIIFLLSCSSLFGQRPVISLPTAIPRVVAIHAGERSNSIDRVKTPRHPSDAKLHQQPAPRFKSGFTLQQESQPHVLARFVAHELGGTPNDNSIAISDDKTILAIQNKYIYAFKQDGTLIFLQTLRSFLGTTQTAVFDPHVVFDPIAHRFIVVMVAGRTYQESQVYIAFSQTNNPAGNWNVYSLNGNPANDQTWSDFPSIAITPSEVLLTTNSYFNGSVNNSGFHQSLIWRINKQEGFAGAPLQSRVVQDLQFNGTNLFNISPAAEGFSSTESILFLSNHALTGGVDFYTIRLNGDDPIIQKTESTIAYAVPRDADQKGTTVKLNTNDCRILDAMQLNQRTYFVLNSNFNNTPSVYFGILSMVNQQPVIRAAMVSDSLDIAFPSITSIEADGQPAIMLGYLHTSSTTFPGSSIVDIRDNGADLVVSRPARIKMGDDYFGVWGDYTDITAIPGEASVLYCGSFGLGAGVLGGGESASIIARVGPSLILGVEEQPTPELYLYPNPAEMYFHLDAPGLAGEVTIELVNMLHQKILTTTEKIQHTGNYRFTIDCRNIAAGIYLALIYHNGRWIATRKLVVNR